MPLASTFALQWYGPAMASAVVTASGSIASAGARGQVRTSAVLSGTGGVTYARPLRLLSAAATASGAGAITAAQPRGRIKAGATIKVNELSQGDVTGAVLEAQVEDGMSLKHAIRLLLSVAAGKTDIVDLGGGAATVKFRDVNDTTDRVTATMAGSERTTVVVDPD
jgi:hypothetical protein